MEEKSSLIVSAFTAAAQEPYLQDKWISTAQWSTILHVFYDVNATEKEINLSLNFVPGYKDIVDIQDPTYNQTGVFRHSRNIELLQPKTLTTEDGSHVKLIVDGTVFKDVISSRKYFLYCASNRMKRPVVPTDQVFWQTCYHDTKVIKRIKRKSLSQQTKMPPPQQTKTPPPQQTKLQPRLCRGWRGSKYSRLIEMSAQEATKLAIRNRQVMPTTFNLAPAFSKWSAYACVEIQQEIVKDGDNIEHCEYVIRSKECSGNCDNNNLQAQLCSKCSALANSVSYLLRNTMEMPGNGNRLVVTKQTSTKFLSPSRMTEVVKKQRRRTSKTTRALRREIKRLRRKLEVISKNDTLSKDDSKMVGTLLEKALPYIEKTYGRDSTNAAIFRHTLTMITRKEGRKGVRYNQETINLAFLLLQQNNASTYEHLRELLWLPSRRHMQRLKNILFSEDASGDGPCTDMMEIVWNELEDDIKQSGVSMEEAREVSVSFDSMRMRKSMITSTRKQSYGRLIGVVVPENLSVAKQEFEKFVANLKSTKTDTNDIHAKDDLLQHALEQNTEHTVLYARCLDPRITKSFVAGKFSTRAVTAHDVLRQTDLVCRALVRQGFRCRVLVSDSAANNQSFAIKRCNIKAADLIPAEVLKGEPGQRELDGNFNVAFKDDWTDEDDVIFCIDDPPHVLKRIVGRMEKNLLSWGLNGPPMSLELLKHIYEASIKHCGVGHLAYSCKLSADHFESNSSSKMKVNRAAQVLSRTMDKICANVEDESKYPMPTIQQGTNRKEFFSRVRQLCIKFDRWFDICNSKDKNRPDVDDFVWMKASNSSKYARELLDILRWVEEWKVHCIDQEGKVQYDIFLSEETYKSLKYVCYGFASLIFTQCVKRGFTLAFRRINQDACEWHFSHIRAASGCHDNPTELMANNADLYSNLNRFIRGGVSNTNVQQGEGERPKKRRKIRRCV